MLTPNSILMAVGSSNWYASQSWIGVWPAMCACVDVNQPTGGDGLRKNELDAGL